MKDQDILFEVMKNCDVAAQIMKGQDILFEVTKNNNAAPQIMKRQDILFEVMKEILLVPKSRYGYIVSSAFCLLFYLLLPFVISCR